MKDIKNQLNMNKTFIMTKIKPDDTELKNIIKEGFEDPQNYLKLNPNVIIGKTIKGPRIDQEKNLIPYSIIGNTGLFQTNKKLNKTAGLKTIFSKAILSISSSSSTNKKETKLPYEYISNEKLDEIYKNISKEIEKNNKVENDLLNDVPGNVKKDLNIQEVTLHSKAKSMDLTRNISKYLAKKSKKNEEDLLMNKQDQFRIRKELEELVLNRSVNSFENKVPVENWIMSLRHSKENNIPSTSYIYYGDVNNPFWIPVREKKHKVVDIIRDPLSKTKTEFPKIIKNQNLIESHISDNNCNKTNSFMFNSFNTFSFLHSNGDSKSFSPTNSIINFSNHLSAKNITVCGKNLLQSERDLVNQMAGRKIMYKRDYLDNHIYGSNSSANAVENERNVLNITNSLNIISNYGSSFSKKGKPVKIKIIK